MLVSFEREFSSQHDILVTDIKNDTHHSHFKLVRKLVSASHYQLQNLL